MKIIHYFIFAVLLFMVGCAPVQFSAVPQQKPTVLHQYELSVVDVDGNPLEGVTIEYTLKDGDRIVKSSSYTTTSDGLLRESLNVTTDPTYSYITTYKSKFQNDKEADQEKSAQAKSESTPKRLLTNKDIIQLVKTGLSEDIIVSLIRKSATKFDLTPEALIKLKQEGVGDLIIKAMIESSSVEVSQETAIGTVVVMSEIEEAEVEKVKLKFIYSHRGKFVFQKIDTPQRFELQEEVIGEKKDYLKEGLEVEGYFFEGKLISISLPPKVDLKVIEAPPGIKGDTKQGGTKTVVLETGKKINVPLFIEAGDIIRVNTEKGEYVERVKSS